MTRLLIRGKGQVTMKSKLIISTIAMYGNVMMANMSYGSIVTLTMDGLFQAILEAVEESLHLWNLPVLMTLAVNGHTMKRDHPIQS